MNELNPQRMLRKALRFTNEVMKRDDVDMNCRRAHCVAVLEIAYMKMLEKSGLSKKEIQEFITSRYTSLYLNL